MAVGGVGCDEGRAAEAGVRLRGGRGCRDCRHGRGRKPVLIRIPRGVYGSRLRGGVLEAGVLGVGVEVGVGVHLVEFGAFFLHGLADQAEGQARRIAFPG